MGGHLPRPVGGKDRIYLAKRSQQRLHFLRQLKKTNLPPSNPHHLLQRKLLRASSPAASPSGKRSARQLRKPWVFLSSLHSEHISHTLWKTPPTPHTCFSFGRRFRSIQMLTTSFFLLALIQAPIHSSQPGPHPAPYTPLVLFFKQR